MRFATLALILCALSHPAASQEATIAAPPLDFGNYDPTMSAKEAVLANWELAASGIRAGEVLGKQVTALTDKDAPFDYLQSQAAFAQKTMLSRYFAASWIYVTDPDLARVEDATLQAIVAATAQTCAAGACAEERAAIRTAFARGAAELGAASGAARAAITERQPEVDAVLMSEQLGMMADYLESGAWAEDLVLTEFGMDGVVIADRIVGTIALWRNIEPYVGLANQEIDNAINAASQQLLRSLRRQTRGMEVLDPAGPELAEITAAANTLAAEFRRASALFSS